MCMWRNFDVIGQFVTSLHWARASTAINVLPIRLNECENKSNNCSFPQTEYKYCYDLVLHYVLHYLNKEVEASANKK